MTSQDVPLPNLGYHDVVYRGEDEEYVAGIVCFSFETFNSKVRSLYVEQMCNLNPVSGKLFVFLKMCI